MTRTVHGVCHHDCPDTCGWTVTVDDGPAGPVATKLRGNPEHPFSQGELCPKVNRLLDKVYAPHRLLHPLRRVGPKGSGEFEQVSWDTALAEIGARLTAIVAEHGGEAILPYGSAGNQSLLATGGIGPRLFHVLGASRQIAALCGPTVGAGVAMTNGTGMCANPTDLEHSQLILIWGTNTKLTNRHLWPWIERARSRGARIVVIDPLRTATAAEADWFLQPLPGTDIALMLAMMHVIVRDDLYDADYVDAHTFGFDELAAHVAGHTPEWAAAETGVPAADIEQLAREYATARPAAIRTLIGAEHHEQGAMLYRTMACLPALTGAWRDRGGGLFRSVGVWQEELVDWVALARPDLSTAPVRDLNMSRLGDVLLNEDPPVKALVLWAANPMVTVPNAEAIRRGFERDDLFMIAHEQFLTDTARYADYVLPATTQIEATDVTRGPIPASYFEPVK